MSEKVVDTITMVEPDDWHLHLRDGPRLKSLLSMPMHCSRAIVMPNLKPPVVNTEMALAYRNRILKFHPDASKFTPLMTLYLTDKTTPEEIRKAKKSGHVFALKLYPAGATTNSDSGVTDITKLDDTLQAMSDKLKIVLEHITTKQAVDYVMSAPANVGATITPQHLLYNRNIIFEKGLKPHYYCLPILKAEDHRKALVKAIQSGSKKFFLGTDSAPHWDFKKECDCCAAGCFTQPIALPLYAFLSFFLSLLHKQTNTHTRTSCIQICRSVRESRLSRQTRSIFKFQRTRFLRSSQK